MHSVNQAAVKTEVPVFDPGLVPEMLHWWRMDDAVPGTDGVEIDSVPNRIGGGPAISQAGGSRPLFVASDANFNNQPTANMTAAQELRSLGINVPTQGAVFIVNRYTAVAGTQVCLSAFPGPGAIDYLNKPNGGDQRSIYNGNIAITPVDAVTTYLMWSANDPTQAPGSQMRAGVNDTEVFYSNNPAAGTRANFHVGTSGGVNGFNGQVAEVMFMSAFPNAMNWTALRTYFNDRYSLGITP